MELPTAALNASSKTSFLTQNSISCNQTPSCTEPKTAVALNVIELTCEVLIAMLAVIGNGFVLIAIASAHSLQTVTNFYVASLATADLLVGLLGIPCTIVAFNGLPTNFAGCLIVNSLIIVLTQISIFGLLVVAFERFFAIRYPYYYYQYCTPRTTVVVIIITWTAGVIVGMVPIFGWNKGKMYAYAEGSRCTFTGVIEMEYMVYMNFFGFVFPPLVAMFTIYGYIYAVVRKQIRKIFSLQMASAAAAANGTTSSQPPKTDAKEVRYNRNKDASTDVQMDDEVVKTKQENGFQSKENHSNDSIMTSSNHHDCSAKRENAETEQENIKEIKGKQPTADVNDSNDSAHHSSKLGEEKKLFPDCTRTKEHDNHHQQQQQQSHQESGSSRKRSGGKSNSTDSNSQAMATKISSSWKREIRAAKWFAVVLTVFTVCWLPLHTMNCVTVFGGPTCLACVTYAVLLSHLNSAVNPILYAYSNSKFAAAFRRMLKLEAFSSSSLNDSTAAPHTRATFR